MGRVSYFQRFSQRENHATNNTLLVLRHFYRAAPHKMNGLLNELCETEFSVGLQFQQQIRGDHSVPDALISQSPLQIFVETKRGGYLDREQIEAHAHSIAAHSDRLGSRLLIGLTKDPITDVDRKSLAELAADIAGIQFVAITFSDIVTALRGACADYEQDLLEIIDDYEAYLFDDDLLAIRHDQILVVPCGTSYDENERFGIYYDPPDRSRRSCPFLGIYRNKCVSLIGKIVTIAVCRYEEGRIEVEHEEYGQLSDIQRDLIRQIIEETDYYDLKAEPGRFYIVDKFVKADFRKVSPSGMLGHRYFEAGAFDPDFSPSKEYTAQEVADLLNGKTFE